MKYELLPGSPSWLYAGRDYVREQARLRDKHTCQECKEIWNGKERRFHVHHKEGLCGKNSRGYDSIKNLEVLVTLCHRCHTLAHDRSKPGRKSVLPQYRKEVIKMRQKGLSYDAIGKKYGVSSQTVYSFLNKKGDNSLTEYTYGYILTQGRTITINKQIMKKFKCKRCDWEWYPRAPKAPKVCPNPKCKSPYWNKPRQNEQSKTISSKK